jgi:hypothetical protein
VDFKESGSRTIRASDFHDLQISVVKHVDEVLARGKFGIPRMELKWDVCLKLPNNLSVCFAGGKRECKNQGNERQKHLASDCPVVARVSHFDPFSKHDDFSSFLPP